MTPVPIQPMRVLPGSAFATAIAVPLLRIAQIAIILASYSLHQTFTFRLIGPWNVAAGAPIVLVHGLLGFDRVKVGPFTLLRYFPGIEDPLNCRGPSRWAFPIWPRRAASLIGLFNCGGSSTNASRTIAFTSSLTAWAGSMHAT